MLYALLAYHVENDVMSWSAEQDTGVMNGLIKAHERVNHHARLGAAARLGETGRALTLRKGEVIDGPFAETKEQLLGFYLLDCADDDAAVAAARELQSVNPGAIYEIRPVIRHIPGKAMPEA